MSDALRARRAWHWVALLVFTLAAAIHTWPWFTADRMPPGDFPGYAAQVQYVRDALLEHGRVPRWCVECYGGATHFTASWKEYLVFPLAVAFEPVLATKLAFVLLRLIGAFGLYWLAARELAAPAAGIAAGYAYSYGAIANHEIEHLDVAVAAALLPYLWICAVELLRRGGARWAIALGVAVACQLANHWVHAVSAPFAVLGLALLRPWRTRGDESTSWRDRALTRRSALRVLAALAVFAVFAASPIAWLAADARNHSLMPNEVTQAHRGIYVERSPFLFANRDDVLAPWLARHQPPYGVAIADGGRRYLGAAVAVVMLAGAAALRRDPARRRWAALAGLVFGVQYWLSLGPRTLLWQVATSLHWTPVTQARLAVAMGVGAALCALAAAAPIGRARAWRLPLLGAAALLLFPMASLWSACASWLPMLAAQRSPGHFFDTAPFALSLAFAACLAGLAARTARPRLAHALVAAVGLALVLDYRPSARAFAAGEPLAPLRRSAALVADLPGEGGSLRVGLGPAYSPLASWVLAQSRAGHAWGWLRWQAGKYWWDSYATAAFGEALAEPASRAWSERYAPLLRAARVRHLLLEKTPAPPAPWRRARGDGRFALWEQPDVPPIAVAYAAWKVWDGARGSAEVVAAADALRANALLVAPPADSSLATSAPAPIAVTYHRPAPERMQLALDAGDAPALVFVSEGYHPWWRAQVDGLPAPVLRAAIAHVAVPVAPGRHEVELRLVRPALVAAADWISACAWLALALGWLWRLFAGGETRRHGTFLERDGSRADQVRERPALLGLEQRVQALERLERRVAHPLGALNAQRRSLTRATRVELIRRNGIGERREPLRAIDLALRALGLQLCEDLRHFGELLVVELELPGEEAQRTPHGSGAERGVSARLHPSMASRRRSPAGPSIRRLATGEPPPAHGGVHAVLLRRGVSLPAGFIAWASASRGTNQATPAEAARQRLRHARRADARSPR